MTVAALPDAIVCQSQRSTLHLSALPRLAIARQCRAAGWSLIMRRWSVSRIALRSPLYLLHATPSTRRHMRLHTPLSDTAIVSRLSSLAASGAATSRRRVVLKMPAILPIFESRPRQKITRSLTRLRHCRYRRHLMPRARQLRQVRRAQCTLPANFYLSYSSPLPSPAPASRHRLREPRPRARPMPTISAEPGQPDRHPLSLRCQQMPTTVLRDYLPSGGGMIQRFR